MKFNNNTTQSLYWVLAIPVLLLAVRFIYPSLFDDFPVEPVETSQALWLLFCGVFTLAAMLPLNFNKSKKTFWLWSAYWWFVLLGRSISWGRDYFPEVPHLYFRILSIFWIAPLVLLLFSGYLRSEIKNKAKNTPVPMAIFSVALCCFLISDTVEHHRMLSFIFLARPEHQDIVEELYEIPFMLALFMTACYYMKVDKIALKK